MRFVNINNSSELVDLKSAILSPIALDGGLYLPLNFPSINTSQLWGSSSLTFIDRAMFILKQLIGDEINDPDLHMMISKALNFPIKLVNLDTRLSVLELFHGPSLSFKDFGCQFLSQLFSHFTINENKHRTILIATSGDTGPAVGRAFSQMDNVKIIILYPLKGISPYQRSQLHGLNKNVRLLEINGSFDDCQSLVKRAFKDRDLLKKYNFNTANSVNIGRLLAQLCYYFEAEFLLRKESSKLSFTIPSGNMGNLTAYLMARKMGLGADQCIVACNINAAFTNYLNNKKTTGTINTLSNAMDISKPSNITRVKYLLGSTWNTREMNIKSYTIKETDSITSISSIYNKYNYIIEPHTAIGITASIKESEKSNLHFINLSTAAPIKYATVLSSLLNKEIDHTIYSANKSDNSSISLSNKYDEFKELLMFNQCSTWNT